MAIGIFTLRQQLRGLLSTNWPGAKTPYVEYLVVGGGGGAGTGNGGGGGGAGGVLTGLLPVTAGISYTTTVGGGGATATNGVNSVLGSVIAVGGGKAANILPGSDGGSGGGGSTQGGLNNAGGSGIFNQGNSGGSSYSASPFGSGGGGGAGTIGLTGRDNSGNGGAGIASAISGTVRTYGGGGGGGSTSQGAAAGLGGVGGGGYNTGPGEVNTGGGGGGASGAGGSGVVIISYPDIYPALASTSGSPTVSTSGSGSISFNGSSQYLTYSPGNTTKLGTNNFTVDGWIRLTATQFNQYIFDNRDSSNSGSGTWAVLFGAGTNGYLGWFANGGPVVQDPSNSDFPIGTWVHFAFVRSSGVLSLYVNGTSVASASDSTNYNASGVTNLIGARYSAGSFFPGYLSNFRIVNGTAIVPPAGGPTAPPSAVTNTQLLLNTVSGAPFVDASSNSFTMTTTGSPAWDQLSPFATGLGYKNRVYTWTSTGTWAVTV